MKAKNFTLMLSIVMCFVFASRVCSASEDDIDKRVKDLEESVQMLQDEQLSLSQQIAERTFVGAYANFAYEDFQGGNNHFNGSKLHLVLNARPHDRIRAYLDIKFQQAAGIAADSWQTNTISTNNRGGIVSVFESYAEFMITRWLNFKGGIFLVPISEYHRNPYMVNRNFADDPMEALEYSDTGIEFLGNVGISDNVKFNYELGLVQGIVDVPSGLTPSYSRDNNSGKSLFGRLVFTFYDQYLFNAEAYYGEYTANGKKLLQLDGYFKATPRDVKVLDHFELLSEFYFARWGNDPTSPVSRVNIYVTKSELTFKFWPRIFNRTFLGKYFDNPMFTLGFRYAGWWLKFRSPLVPNQKEDSYTFAFGYRPIHNFVMHVQYEINNGNAVFSRGPNNGLLVNMAYAF